MFPFFRGIQAFPLERSRVQLRAIFTSISFPPLFSLFLLAILTGWYIRITIHSKPDWPWVGQSLPSQFSEERWRWHRRTRVQWYHQGPRFFSSFHPEKLWLSPYDKVAVLPQASHKHPKQEEEGRTEGLASHAHPLKKCFWKPYSSTYMSLARHVMSWPLHMRSIGCVYFSSCIVLVNRTGFCSYSRGETEYWVDNYNIVIDEQH